MVGGVSGVILAGILSCSLCFSTYWFGGLMTLRRYRAQPLSEEEAPDVYAIMRDLSSRMDIPLPAIYLIPVRAANAFAVGRDRKHAAVAVTYGILNLLNEEEMKGVLAHELAHVQQHDILTASVAAAIAGAIGLLASMLRRLFLLGGSSSHQGNRETNPLAGLLTGILAPLSAVWIHLGVIRERDYLADACGARVCGNPLYLASALRKLEAESRKFPFRTAEPASAPLFIMNPLNNQGFARLFNTHPPIEERIARLEKRARETAH